MNQKNRTKILVIPAIVLVSLLGACAAVPVTGGDGGNGAPSEQMMDSGQAPSSAEAEMDSASDAAVMESEASDMMTDIQHSVFPKEALAEGIVKEEIDTSILAEKKSATGDSLRLGNFERPYTKEDMVYHPEADLLNVEISNEDDFYAFSLELAGVDGQMGYPSGKYGIELDTDLDGRGDLLLWAAGDGNSAWNIDNVMVLSDENEDVGGSLAVIPDSNPGDGYESVVFSAEMLEDPDAAWKRVDPLNPARMQLSIKKEIVGSAFFLWKAWRDAGTADPGMFDYNDHFSDPMAGSPQSSSAYYPVNDLELVDSTCWIAFNFQPSGNELGGCYKAPAKVKPESEPDPQRPPSLF